MKVSIKLCRVFGIEIRAHVSWLIIVALVILSLASHFTMSQPGWSPALSWSAAILTGILFFSSVVAHELAHSRLAIGYGIPVKSITLFLFGGVSEIEEEAKSPAEEFWIALVGPLMSLAISALSGSIGLLIGFNTFFGAIAAWLAGINLMLAIFNLLPGFPLDGGRVLRSIIWWKTGDPWRATRSAAKTGQGFATILIIAGILLIMGPERDFGGLWLVFLGWFLLDAARSSRNQIEVDQALRGVNASDLMTGDCPRIDRNMPLSEFAYEYLFRKGRRYFLVTDGVFLLGIITAAELKSVKRDRWPDMVVADVMKPLDRLNAVSPDTPGRQVVDLMAANNINLLPVIAEGQLLGIASAENLVQLIATRREFGQTLGQTLATTSQQARPEENLKIPPVSGWGETAGREAHGLR
jgi:Zn-dependent protease